MNECSNSNEIKVDQKSDQKLSSSDFSDTTFCTCGIPVDFQLHLYKTQTWGGDGAKKSKKTLT